MRDVFTSRCGLAVWLLCFWLLSAALPACAAPAFKLAVPGYKYAFPRDHGSHPQYATEWWYYTGHLRAGDGRRFGYQLTWFRVALSPQVKRASKWAPRDLYFAHLALTDERGQRFFFTDKIERGSLGLAGADAGSSTPRIWIGSWKLQYSGKRGERQSATASGSSDAMQTKGVRFGLQLNFRNLKPPAIHGERGVSQKSAGVGRASHYYSLTRIETRGMLRLGEETLSVTGESWFDHEFGSGQMAENQTGWDWSSIQLQDGRELMLYRLRLRNGGTEPFSSGTLVEKDGRVRHLKLADFQMRPLDQWRSPKGTLYPSRWRLTVPRYNLVLNTEPVMANQELRPVRSGGGGLTYWEGSIRVQGTQNGRPVAGQGYLEMTGYERAFKGTF